MKRRLFSLVLAMLMITAMVPVSVFAEDVTIDMGNAAVMDIIVEDAVSDLDTDTVKVDISVSKNGGFAGLNGILIYDEDLFELVEQPVLSTSFSEFDFTGGAIKSPHAVMLASAENVLGDGVLVTYTFKVKSGVAAGKYDLTFMTSGINYGGVALEVLDEKGQDVEHTVVNGSITVPGYTVSFDANGGSGAPDAMIKSKGISLTIPNKVPVRGGYDFAGWAESADAEEAEYSAGGKYTKNADVTLYAVWEKKTLTEELGLEVELADGIKGEEVTVDINITNNPGIGSMAFDLVYDNDVLEVKSWSDSGYPGSGNWIVSALDRYEDKLNFRFMNLNNITSTGTILSVTFKVKDNAPEELTEIKLVIENENDFYQFVDGAEIDVPVIAYNGGVNVGSGQLLGDINLDETVDMNDAILLLQHIMFPDLYPVGYNGGLDFDASASVDMNDAIRLLQHAMFPDLYPIEDNDVGL